MDCCLPSPGAGQRETAGVRCEKASAQSQVLLTHVYHNISLTVKLCHFSLCWQDSDFRGNGPNFTDCL